MPTPIRSLEDTAESLLCEIKDVQSRLDLIKKRVENQQGLGTGLLIETAKLNSYAAQYEILLDQQA